MIHTRGLTRHFTLKKKEIVEAVRGLDIDVEKEELVALLGPNGAGKTTTLRMLTTLLPPTSGTAIVAGCDVRKDPAGTRARIGHIGQGHGAGDNFRVVDELVTQGRCYGMTKAEARKRAGELLASLNLESLATRVAATLSGGQRRRLDIALGLVHRPDLLFLDEPSTGLDPHNRADLWRHILRLREEHGTTIVLTTHYLDEADAMAERVMIIDHGKVIADDTPENLKADLAGDLLTIGLPDERDAGRAAEAAKRIPTARDIATEGTVLTLRVRRGPEVLPEFLHELDSRGLRARSAEVRRPTLDDVFLALTGRSLRETDVEAA